jgi:hypothetical protein
MENAEQSSPNGARKPPVGQRFKPGNPGGPGRQRKTDEIRQLERMTRAQVQEQLEKLVGPALKRLLKIVANGQDPEAVRIALALLDRVVGAVPSASYINANVNAGTEPERIDAAQVNTALMQWQIAKGLLPAPDTIDNSTG